MRTQNADKDADRLNHFYIAAGNIKWYSHSAKQFDRFLRN